MSDSCTMSKGINFALSNGPGINYSGSHQTGIGGCQIDTNSAWSSFVLDYRYSILNIQSEDNIYLSNYFSNNTIKSGYKY